MLSDALKVLRITHSGFLNELQQIVCNYVDESNRTNEKIEYNQRLIEKLHADNIKLQETMIKLDEVKYTNISFIHTLKIIILIIFFEMIF